MATLKTYTVTCPDPDCANKFTIERDPETLGDDGELIECPACFNEWEWEYEAGVITLLFDFDDDEDENDGLPGIDEDEDEPDDEDEDEPGDEWEEPA